MTRTYGFEHGLKQIKETEGNEVQARKLWEKQKTKGYAERELVQFSPMLSYPYQMFRNKVPNKILIQPEYDGIRMIVEKKMNGGILFTTQSGKEIKGFHKLRKKFETILTTDNMIIDGQLYNSKLTFDELYDNFKRGDDTNLNYYAFDCFIRQIPNCTFLQRYILLNILLSGTYIETDNIGIVDTQRENKHDISKIFDFCSEDGWRGVIIRDPDSPYVHGKKSKGVLKLKEFKTRKFQIVNHIKDDQGNLVWECKINDVMFNVNPPTTLKKLKEIGCVVSVKFKDYNEDGTPQFPKAVG